MKIRKIQIAAFGKLNGFTLDMSDGFHVLYGVNEAGKSTLMYFIRVMFYGFNKNARKDNLAENDRERLVMQLRLLQCLNGQRELDSILYSPKAELHGVLERFIDDLLGFREQWRSRLTAKEPGAVRELYIRTLTVFGLCGGDTGLLRHGCSPGRRGRRRR